MSTLLSQIELAHFIAEKLPIRFIGDPILNTACQPFTEEEFGSQEMHELAEQLSKTLQEYRAVAGTGRGLAANQIGSNRCMIALWLEEKIQIMVNPSVIDTEGLASYWESCISSGSLVIGEVIRPWKGTFFYQNFEGEKHILKANEFETRLLLHEIDHLDGEHCLNKYEKGTIKFVTGGKGEVLGYELKRIE